MDLEVVNILKEPGNISNIRQDNRIDKIIFRTKLEKTDKVLIQQIDMIGNNRRMHSFSMPKPFTSP